MTREETLAKIDELIASGADEKALERFVIDHFKELPEDIQGKVLLSFYSESIAQEADEARIAKLQEEGVDALDKLAAMKFEDEAK